MCYAAIDPFTKKPVTVARQLRDCKLQRALMQFFEPESYFEVRRALELAGRRDLIGSGRDGLIPAKPAREPILTRRRRANGAVREDHCHAVQIQSEGGARRGDAGVSLRPGHGRRRGRGGGVAWQFLGYP
jgi:hypothetical protein